MLSLKYLLGQVPLVTKGSMAKFLMKEEDFNALTNEKPTKTTQYFFLFSILFQVFWWVFKRLRTSRNIKIQSYVNDLRKSIGCDHKFECNLQYIIFSVDNILNLYGYCVIVTISCFAFYTIYAHMRDIEQNLYGEEELSFPKEFYYWLVFTLVCVYLPYGKSYALR